MRNAEWVLWTLYTLYIPTQTRFRFAKNAAVLDSASCVATQYLRQVLAFFESLLMDYTIAEKRFAITWKIKHKRR